MSTILLMLLGGAMGILIRECGIKVNDWRGWAILAVLLCSNVVSELTGAGFFL